MSALPKAETDSAPKRVLVVEDDVLIRHVIAEAMRDAGLFVVEAGSGTAAMGYLGSGAPVDVVFSDIEMNGADDGLRLAHDIRAGFPDIPVILTTGSAMPSYLADADAFIAKPYQISSVLELVTKTLGVTRDGVE